MAIRLYSYWRSSAAYRIRIALNLKGLEYEIKTVSLAPGVAEHRSPTYRSKNPQMLVPFFEDGDVAMSQSAAIFAYLEETYPESPLLPESVALRSRVRAFAHAIACDIHPLQNLRVQQYLKSQYQGNGVEWARHWIGEGFSALEEMVDPGPFCFGTSPTMADAFLVPQIYNARRFQLAMDAYPKLTAIEARCNELDAFIDAAPEQQTDAT